MAPSLEIGITNDATPMGRKKGSLVIAGSGIASVGHFTLEAVGHVKQADKVFYLVCDPATEAFIQENNQNSIDLHQFYGAKKVREHTYIQMAEIMLQNVRAGHDVVGVFYGHPGVFVNPSHRAIAIARSEGYEAKMLAGVSAEDCLFADLGVDPAVPGCVTYEATDLLARNHPLPISSHLILWQVGCVGVSDLGFDNGHFHLLVDKLEEQFGANHLVIHYIAAVIPQHRTIMKRFTIGDLREPENMKEILPISTFYLPPKQLATLDQPSAEALGLFNSSKALPPVKELFLWSPYRDTNSELPIREAYGEYERTVLAEMPEHEESTGLSASRAMRECMFKLAMDPKALAQYRLEPRTLTKLTPGLTVKEKAALEKADAVMVYNTMKGPQHHESKRMGSPTLSDKTPMGSDSAAILILILGNPSTNSETITVA